MQSILTKACNTELGAPREWDTSLNGECHKLPVAVGKNGNYATYTSYWRPTKEECDAIQEGAVVVLTVFGANHPPVAVGVDFAAEVTNAAIVTVPGTAGDPPKSTKGK